MSYEQFAKKDWKEIYVYNYVDNVTFRTMK